MSVVTTNKSHLPIRIPTEIHVSRYDYAAAWLMASLLLLSAIVAVLFLVWLSRFQTDTRQAKLIPAAHGATLASTNLTGKVAAGLSEQEFPELSQMTLDESLAAVFLTPLADRDTLAGWGDRGDGEPGLPDVRQVSPVPPPVTSNPMRWSIDIAAGSRSEYVEILDFFGLTLGGVSRTTNQIHYFSDLTSPQPQIRVGLRKDERRVYFMNRNNRFRRWEAQFMRAAGVEIENCLIVHFYEPQLRRSLSGLEQSAISSASKHLSDVRQTIFGVRAVSPGYEFYVKRIIYRGVN